VRVPLPAFVVDALRDHAPNEDSRHGLVFPSRATGPMRRSKLPPSRLIDGRFDLRSVNPARGGHGDVLLEGAGLAARRTLHPVRAVRRLPVSDGGVDTG
jgi:hypothetical protein